MMNKMTVCGLLLILLNENNGYSVKDSLDSKRKAVGKLFDAFFQPSLKKLAVEYPNHAIELEIQVNDNTPKPTIVKSKKSPKVLYRVPKLHFRERMRNDPHTTYIGLVSPAFKMPIGDRSRMNDINQLNFLTHDSPNVQYNNIPKDQQNFLTHVSHSQQFNDIPIAHVTTGYNQPFVGSQNNEPKFLEQDQYAVQGPKDPRPHNNEITYVSPDYNIFPERPRGNKQSDWYQRRQSRGHDSFIRQDQDVTGLRTATDAPTTVTIPTTSPSTTTVATTTTTEINNLKRPVLMEDLQHALNDLEKKLIQKSSCTHNSDHDQQTEEKQKKKKLRYEDDNSVEEIIHLLQKGIHMDKDVAQPTDDDLQWFKFKIPRPSSS